MPINAEWPPEGVTFGVGGHLGRPVPDSIIPFTVKVDDGKGDEAPP